MKPTDPLKLVGQLLDLPIVDSEDRWCGIVDDVELTGTPGKELRVAALLVGPGAYEGRLPRWAFWLTRKIAGAHIARVPFDRIDTIAAAVHLKCRAEELKLHVMEDRARRLIPRVGAM